MPAISPWDNGNSSIVSDRPGNASGTELSPSSRAEPVNKNRPGRGSRSTVFLMANHRSGTRCTSSMSMVSGTSRNATGSATADARTCGSSRNLFTAFGRPARQCSANVLFPVWRAPLMITTRVSASASPTISAARRGRYSSPSLTSAPYLLLWICRRMRCGSADQCVVDLPTSALWICRPVRCGSADRRIVDLPAWSPCRRPCRQAAERIARPGTTARPPFVTLGSDARPPAARRRRPRHPGRCTRRRHPARRPADHAGRLRSVPT